ncbi:hypothetical protein SeMB42_g02216 [Synchytrium endobioticum]|uniref:Uncharacterized protein n=1 Tax=Synchytrium endobioticum TaxID=286115 RepID=A0A507DGY7_9FUNG|nr:hypothetical protein SeMB42_g02216 [Synchytrium endobioticum]
MPALPCPRGKFFREANHTQNHVACCPEKLPSDGRVRDPDYGSNHVAVKSARQSTIDTLAQSSLTEF